MQQIERNLCWLDTLSARSMSDLLLKFAASPPASFVLVQSLYMGLLACPRDQHTKSIDKSTSEAIKFYLPFELTFGFMEMALDYYPF